MDDLSFDRLARLVGAGRTRRTILGAIAAGVFGAAGLGDRAEAAFRPRPLGAVCAKNADCASRLCRPPDATGRRHCGCASAADCPAPGGACQAATCVAGVCGVTTCAPDQSCCGGACKGAANAACQSGADCCSGNCIGAATCCPLCPSECPFCFASTDQGNLCSDDEGLQNICNSSADCPPGEACFGVHCKTTCPALA